MTNKTERWLAAVSTLNGRAITWPRTGSLAAWMISGVLVFAGLFSKPLLDSALGEPLPPYVTFYAAVTISALLGGPVVGLTVTLITVILTWYFFLPHAGVFALAPSSTLILVGMYLVLSGFQAWIVGNARLALDRLAESEGRRDRAARESVHRIKNLIAVVQAISSKLAREVHSVPEYKAVLSNRLVALASAQDVLVQSGWSDVDVAVIIKSALAPFLPNPGLEVRYGPKLAVPARHVSGLNMALYELCTNSLKYGALAEGRGPVTLWWKKQDGVASLEWNEETPAAVSRDEGLGTQLIRFALGSGPDCKVDYVVEGRQVRAVFCWPLQNAAEDAVEIDMTSQGQLRA